jgi:hypothetical protein
MRLARALTAALLSGACASHEMPEDWPALTAAHRACAETPGFAPFVQATRARVLERWELPEGTWADQEVVVGLLLDGQGRVVRSAVFRADSRRLAQSALRAVQASQPFEVPAALRCVAGMPIVGKFRNPVKQP